jgi:hypothetical protein
MMQSQSDLPQVITALHTASGFPRTLYSGQQQSDESTNHGNHDQKLYERKAVSIANSSSHPGSTLEESRRAIPRNILCEFDTFVFRARPLIRRSKPEAVHRATDR